MSESQSGSGEYRQQQLKNIVNDLHEGSDIKAVQKQFADLIRNVSPEEIAQLEQALITEGIPVEQVQKLCDVHVQVFEQALDRQKKTKVLPGHPIHTFVQENKALRKILKRIRPLFKRASRPAQRDELKRELEELKKIEIHYRRKENQLFPYLEQVQFTGPSKVMWGKHDEIRDRLKELEAAVNNEEWDQVAALGPGLIRAMRRMIFMEEKILYPTSMKKLSLQRTYPGDVLAHLQHPFVLPLITIEGEVSYMDEPPAQAYPELGSILLLLPETIQNLLDNVHTRRRMAVLHRAPDYPGASRKYAFFALRVIPDNIVFIDVGNIDRQTAQHQVDLPEA